MGPDEKRLHEALRALAKDERAQTTPPRVEEAVMRQWDAGRRGEVARRFPGSSGWAMLAAAASLIVAVSAGSWWMTLRSEPSNGRSIDIAVALPTPSPSYDLVAWEPDADSLQIVRMRVASATLKAHGYAISDPTGDGTVEIEMIVGLDGMARSVRVNSAAVPMY
jgi:hypothetical protein